MTEEQHARAQALARCSMLPGGFDKRFARDLAALPPSAELSEKQAACLDRLAYRYRRQMPDRLVPLR